MLKTRFTELVGCTVPIQQAGMGSLSNPDFAASVTNAGGLGMVSVYGEKPAAVIEKLDRVREKTAGVFGANFIMHFMDPALVDECIAVAAARAKVIDFFYFDPDPALVKIAHDGGALACWQVGSLEEAQAAEDAGCDFIIAQGIEAGGHVRGRIGVLALLNQVLEVVKIPVLAAGGIGSGRTMAAVLAAGADGVRVGTRFVTAQEAAAHPVYMNALIAAEAKDTVYTEAFSVGWPDAPHRVLRSCIEAAQAFDGDIVGEFHTSSGEPAPAHRFQILTIDRSITGAVEAMPQWAGESVDGVKRVQPAAEIIRELVEDCEKHLRRWA